MKYNVIQVAIIIGQLSHGGAERQLLLLVEGMQKYNCEFVPVIFCTSSSTDPYGPLLSARGVEWYAAPETHRTKVKRLIWLVGQLRHKRYALLYGIINTGTIYAGAASILTGIPYLGSIRSANPSLSWQTRLLSKLFNNRAEIVIANSQSCVESLRHDLGVKHDRVKLIPNAVVVPPADSTASEALRYEWGIPKNALVIGTVATLKSEKRVSYFIKVGQILVQRLEKPIHFVWIGDGPERAKLSTYCEGMSHDVLRQFHFPGARTDIADCLNTFNVFVLTSAYEGLPNALLEAMATGLPCVATDVPGSRDVIAQFSDIEIGILADAENPELFASKLIELLQNHDQIHKLGKVAQEFINNNYRLDSMTEQFCNVFRSISKKIALRSNSKG